MATSERGLVERLREAAGDEHAFVLVDPDALREAADALYTATEVRGAFQTGDGAPCWHNDCQCCAGWVEKIKEDRAALSAAEARLRDEADYLEHIARGLSGQTQEDIRGSAARLRAALTEGERDG